MVDRIKCRPRQARDEDANKVYPLYSGHIETNECVLNLS